MVASRKKRVSPTASLTIRNIPRSILERLKAHAHENQRSMQGEILSILVEAAGESTRRLTPLEILAEVRASGLKMPDENESVQMIRDDRDHGH